MNYNQARYNMIKQQFRTWHVNDEQTLDLFSEIHRENFMPVAYKDLALADIFIPLLHNQYTLPPKIEARMLQSLEVKPDDKILEVGTGCGYLTALLANLGSVVHSVDIYPEFAQLAGKSLKKYGLNNVHLKTGNAGSGWQQEAPYDVIVVTGSIPLLGESFQQQLQPEGRLCVITGTSPVMEVTLIKRLGQNDWSREVLFETDILPLIDVQELSGFTF